MQKKMSKAEVRALRRSLAQIEPESSNSQHQSPLFATLPSEVRNLIFEYALCQTIDSHRSRPEPQIARSRPNHERMSAIDTSLLRTCRLVYYETRAIPLQSATHHLYGDLAASYDSVDWDHYLFHFSRQSGQHLYHLHSTSWGLPNFSKYLQKHLHWRKITFTICASNWAHVTQWRTNHNPWYADHTSNSLGRISFPNTCREVNLEFETLKTEPQHRRILREICSHLRALQLARRDESKIELDEGYCMEYTWEGSVWQPGDWQTGPGGYVSAEYHVMRLCWRAREPERNYMHYDHWDCLRSHRIKRVPSGFLYDHEESQ